MIAALDTVETSQPEYKELILEFYLKPFRVRPYTFIFLVCPDILNAGIRQ